MFSHRLPTHTFRYATISGLILMCMVSSACDTLRIHNGAGQPVGLLIDAQTSGGFLNDQAVVTSRSTLLTTNYRSSASSNEVIAFTNDRPPKHVMTPWTPQKDIFDIPFA